MTMPTLPPRLLQHAWRCAAACDTLAAAENGSTTFSYDPDWLPGIAMARYDNGAGDHLVGLFTSDGQAVLKGFDHESELSPHARDEYAPWPGIHDGLPQDMLALLQDEALEHEDVTFCCWSLDGHSWNTGTAQIPEQMDDGSGWLLPMVQMDAPAFIGWAKDYYGDDFSRMGESAIIAAF